MRGKSHGPGWVIYETSYYEPTNYLISIISRRRAADYVRDFVEQTYMDRHCAIATRLDFKKSRKSNVFPVNRDPFTAVMHCGHDPWIFAVPAKNIVLLGDELEIVYSIKTGEVDDWPTFGERRNKIRIFRDLQPAEVTVSS